MSEPQEKVDVGSLKDTFLECPVCVEHFNQTDRRPRLLHSCLHAFCTQCLQQLLDKEGKGQITCPLCRQVQNVHGQADTLEIDGLRDKLVEFLQIKQDKKAHCSECPERNEAISRCQECHSNLCKECDFVHRRHRLSRDHVIISLGDLTDQPIASFAKSHFCPKHPKHNLEFYCATEEKLCCVSCTVLGHKGHDLQQLEEASAAKKTQLETKLAEVHSHADRLRNNKKQLKCQEKHIEDTREKSLSDINTMFGHFKTILDTRQQQLMTDVKQRSARLLSILQKSMESTDQTLALIDSTDTYYAQAKEKADIVEMLQMYPAINRTLESLIGAPTSLQLGIEQTMLDIMFVPHDASHIETLMTNAGVLSRPMETLQDATFVKESLASFEPETPSTNLSRSTFLSLLKKKQKKKMIKHILGDNPLEHSSTLEQRIDEPGSQLFTVGSVSVHVYSADITTLKVDAIVNAANGNLSHGSGVARAIRDAAGDALDDEGRRYVHENGPIPVSGVVRTTAGRMPCRMVFHAVGPSWYDYKDYEKQKCEDDLCKTILRCLVEASNAGAAIAAVPAIGSGIFRVPKQKCCDAYVRATKLFGMWNGSKECLTEVHFVDKCETMLQMIASTFSQSKHSTITPRPEEERFMKVCMQQGVRQRSRSRGRQTSSIPQGGQTTQIVSESHTVSAVKGSYTYSVNGKGMVKLYTGDIVKASVDALVTWENPDIEPIISASKAVRQATGHINLKSLDCNLLCVSSTPAGNMSDKKHIIHAIVPVSSLSQSDIQTLLRRTLQTVCGTDASAALTPLTTSQVKLEDFAKAFCHVTTEVMRERRVPEIHLIEKNPKVIAKLKEVFDSHLTLESEEDTMDINMAGATGGEKECSICKDSCKDPKTLKCGHRFCRECIDHYFNNYKPVCPNCGAIYGPVSGNMPDGKMYVRVNSYSHLPGHPSDGTISITYSIPNGIQKEEHPNPGKPYIGAYWTAYLPNSFEGEKVLRLLKVAFDRHLTFTVGRSVTTGVENKVTWNDIHHKTSHSGNFGYPDPDYLRRVHEELAAKGVTEADIDWSTPV
ncbi:uncharacterized protein [Haliotis asinina]|uniref:uncharacterized protein n=1 Tax=Haliotis asinina TaxID=109174 RepID=UPI003531D9CD